MLKLMRAGSGLICLLMLKARARDGIEESVKARWRSHSFTARAKIEWGVVSERLHALFVTHDLQCPSICLTVKCILVQRTKDSNMPGRKKKKKEKRVRNVARVSPFRSK